MAKLENTVVLLAETAVRKENTHRRPENLSGTFLETDYLGLANNSIGTECVLAFEETVRSKSIYLRKAEAVLQCNKQRTRVPQVPHLWGGPQSPGKENTRS